MPFDQHTHNLNPEPGTALINMPMEALLKTEEFNFVPGQFYSAGIFPLFEGDWETAYQRLEDLLQKNKLAGIGECGLDKRSTVPMSIQKDYFERQMILADRYKLPLIIHCVKAWDELLHLNQEHYAKNKRIVHGFRGKPELCRQLLDAGFYLSFGPRFNPLSLCLCPPDRRMMETDASGLSIQQVEELIRREC